MDDAGVTTSWAGSFCLGCDSFTLGEPYCSFSCRDRDVHRTPPVQSLSHQYEAFRNQGCSPPTLGLSTASPQLLPGVSFQGPQGPTVAPSREYPVALPTTLLNILIYDSRYNSQQNGICAFGHHCPAATMSLRSTSEILKAPLRCSTVLLIKRRHSLLD